MPIPESQLFQLVRQQATHHFSGPVSLHKAGRYVAAVSVQPAPEILVKMKYSTEHLPDKFRQVLSHVGWFTFSEADIANEAPPVLVLAQGASAHELQYVVLPRQLLRQLISRNGQDFHFHLDFTRQGHVFASRGLTSAERESCATSREYLAQYHPERDLTTCLGNWQHLRS